MASPGELSIVFLVDENPNVASAGFGPSKLTSSPATLVWRSEITRKVLGANARGFTAFVCL